MNSTQRLLRVPFSLRDLVGITFSSYLCNRKRGNAPRSYGERAEQGRTKQALEAR